MRKSFFMVVFLAGLMLLSPASIRAASPTGYQGASQWAVPELDKALQYGLITDSISTRMNAPITREEFAEIAVKLYENGTGDLIETTDTNVFVDTNNPEIFKAYELGIVSGTDAMKRLFSPHALISREQVAAMLHRTIIAMGMETPDEISTGGFADFAQIAPYAREAVSYMSGRGFIMGSENHINPRGTCTREMAALIATRVFESTDAKNNMPSVDDETNYYEEPDSDYYSDPGSNESNDDSSYYPDPTPLTDDNYADDDADPYGDNAALPDNMENTFPLLNDAQILYIDEWDGGDGSVIYSTNYSIAKALEFYRGHSLYKDFKQMKDITVDDNPGLSVYTGGLHYLIGISPNNTGLGGPTMVHLEVFKFMYMEGIPLP